MRPAAPFGPNEPASCDQRATNHRRLTAARAQRPATPICPNTPSLCNQGASNHRRLAAARAQHPPPYLSEYDIFAHSTRYQPHPALRHRRCRISQRHHLPRHPKRIQIAIMRLPRVARLPGQINPPPGIPGPHIQHSPETGPASHHRVLSIGPPARRAGLQCRALCFPWQRKLAAMADHTAWGLSAPVKARAGRMTGCIRSA